MNRECTSKVCTRCKIEKHLDAFGNAGRGDERLRSYCKECAADYRRHPDAIARAKSNRDKYNANRREKYDPEREKFSKIRINYNLSKEQYEALYDSQSGSCAICGATENLVVDHDHACCPAAAKSCGKCVRGLLCGNCNNGLGRFNDNVDSLQKAAEYLRRF